MGCGLFVIGCSGLQSTGWKKRYARIIVGEVADTAVQVIRVRRVDQNNSYIYTDTIPYANGRFSYDIHTAKPLRLFNLCFQ